MGHQYFLDYNFVQKSIPRIIEINKLISNHIKQVQTCIFHPCNTP